MKSKIQLDLNVQGNPCITITHIPSDDVRDKLFTNLLQLLKGPVNNDDGESVWFKVTHKHHVVDGVFNGTNSVLELEPVQPCNYKEEVAQMQYAKEHFDHACGSIMKAVLDEGTQR